MAESITPQVVELTINNQETVIANNNPTFVYAKLQVVNGVLTPDDRQTSPGVLQ
jgi:hypothetical protein